MENHVACLRFIWTIKFKLSKNIRVGFETLTLYLSYKEAKMEDRKRQGIKGVVLIGITLLGFIVIPMVKK